ncbi:MAG: hypothetical protein EBR40_00145 [Proteobacteria bacterium]|nr:hypothetical protein [Pseudomonadota bacterium]
MAYWKPKKEMDHYVAFYLPSKTGKGEDLGHVDRAKLIDATMKFLLLELGGATMTEGAGYFHEAGIVHAEKVTICKSFCSEEKLDEHKWNINRMANSLAIEFGQICLSVEIDGAMYFFGPNDEYKRRYALPRPEGVDKYGYEKYINSDLPVPAV